MTEPTTAPREGTLYRVRVQHVEACNCSNGCNCQFNGFPDYGPCETIWGNRVTEGSYGEVDLRGVEVVFAARWPKAIHEGHGQGVVFINESATSEQIEAMWMIASGQAGGMPHVGFAETFDRPDGPIVVPITMQIDGRRSRLYIPSVIEMQLVPLKDPVTGDEKEVRIVYPGGGFEWPEGGFEWPEGDICTTETMSVRYGDMQFAYPGKWAAHAAAAWTNHGLE